jgi:multidrug efflux pump subunit AcrB
MNSVIALVILFGIAVNNGIILYESCVEGLKEHALSEGDIEATVIRCCGEKLRAILVTTGTTICAMLPFAIDPWNKSAQSSLAVVLTGGLFVSTLVVMAVIPVILARHFKRRSL